MEDAGVEGTSEESCEKAMKRTKVAFLARSSSWKGSKGG